MLQNPAASKGSEPDSDIESLRREHDAKLSELQSTRDQLEVPTLTIAPACQTTHAVFPLQRNNTSLEDRLRQLQDDRKRHDAEIQELQSAKARLEVC
jgi:cell division protein ZapA (FtsZ GTPase activity inhibitor)